MRICGRIGVATVIVFIGSLIGCVGNGGNPSPSSSGPEPAASRLLPADGPNADAYPALHNLIQVSDGIYSGGEPHGEAAFADLARLGIKTVASVDGARPEIELARKYGLRYVHIPIGYDGVDDHAGLSLARLVQDAEGPVYLHCHHGKHRGPAAAAVACVAAGVTDGPGALAILERAGTSKNYAGLWRDVENYAVPQAGIELPPLVEVAEVDSMVAAMAKLDRSMDNLALCRDVGWGAPPDHPDLMPAQEALLVRESLHESIRLEPEEFDGRFIDWLKASEQLALQLESSLHARNHHAATEHFSALKATCLPCHKAYRN